MTLEGLEDKGHLLQKAYLGGGVAGTFPVLMLDTRHILTPYVPFQPSQATRPSTLFRVPAFTEFHFVSYHAPAAAAAAGVYRLAQQTIYVLVNFRR